MPVQFRVYQIQAGSPDGDYNYEREINVRLTTEKLSDKQCIGVATDVMNVLAQTDLTFSFNVRDVKSETKAEKEARKAAEEAAKEDN